MSADGTDTLGVVPLHAQRQPLAPPPAGIDAAIDPTLERVLAAILDAMVPSLPPATAAALADAHLARIAAADGPDPPPRDAVVLALGTGALAVGSPRNVARLG
ncbi:hypothetical protein HK405_001896 [Cladochytrium tenue]|nr:hypothetical protein HK405_001896 [Cladochytrium tenue]